MYLRGKGDEQKMQWNLIILRKESGMNQRKMADILGISADAYGMKERGDMQFKLDEIFIIAEYFDKNVEEIFLKRNFGKTEKQEAE